MPQDEQIEGRHPVLEALKAGRPLNKIMVLRDTPGPLGEALNMARAAGIPIVQVHAAALDRMARSRNHQGIIALASPRGYADLDDLLAKAAAGPRQPFLLLLDGVMDPQNLGALIRTAEAMGVDGVIVPERRSAGLTPTVERASAGAIEHLPVARITNLTQTIKTLQERGYWLVGAEAGTGGRELPAFDRPLGLVMGGEGTGLHRLVKEACDFLVSLPMYGRVNSLNVSAAGAILMHALAEKRQTVARK